MSKKLIIAAVVAVLSIGAAAMATPSRMDTLGQNTGLSYVSDDTGIFSNPALVNYYRNSVIIHMGGVGGGDPYAYGGVNLGLGEMITFGIFVARNGDNEAGLINSIVGSALDGTNPGYPVSFGNHWADYNVGTNLADDVAVGALNNGAMTWMNPIDLILGLKLGNINLGVSYYIANGKMTQSYTDDITDTVHEEQKARLQSVKVGLSAAMGNIQPELSFAYDPYKYTSNWNDDNINTDFTRELKGRKFVLAGRVFVNVNDNLQIVPQVAWQTANGDVTYDDNQPFYSVVGSTVYSEADLLEKYKASRISAGIGINYKAENILVASSIGMNWGKTERTLEIDGLDGTVTSTQRLIELPVVGLGLEYQATKILVLRTGISTTTIYAKGTDQDQSDVLGSLNYDNKTSVTYQETRAATGLGLHFGNLVVDLTAGDMILAGEDGYNELFSAMDVKYMFK